MHTIHSAQDIRDIVNEIGFLPFFENKIKGFSIREMTPRELWFADDVDGPWEWKGPAIRLSGGAYGKFFNNKAGFVSREWFYDFANYRRDGYDFDARYNDGLAKYKDLRIIQTIEKTGPVLSKVLKAESGYSGKDGMKGFDTIINRLGMQCYIICSDFEYMTDKNGNRYGWGVARYATPEQYFGDTFADLCYQRTPEESFERIVNQVKKHFPDADEKDIRKLLMIK